MQSEDRIRKRALAALTRALARAEQAAVADPTQLTAVAQIAGQILTKVEGTPATPNEEDCRCEKSWPRPEEFWEYIRAIVEKRIADSPDDDNLFICVLLVALKNDRVGDKLRNKLAELCGETVGAE